MKTINIIELPSNLGLKKKDWDMEPGVSKLPDWLRSHGLYDHVAPRNVYRLEASPYAMELDDESGVRNADKLIDYARKQADFMADLWDDGFQLILGGDCSILIGNAISLKQKGNYGLFFLDGHTDFMFPRLSSTKAAAGMDLSIVTGHAHDKLSNIHELAPYFEERNVYCVGNREFFEPYVQPILEAEIEYVDLEKLRLQGPAKTVNAFLSMVEKHGLDGFFIHLDVDVLNDEIMPAVDSRKADGIWYHELEELLKPLLSSPKAVGLEITILDPNLDEKGEVTTEFVRHMKGILDQVRG